MVLVLPLLWARSADSGYDSTTALGQGQCPFIYGDFMTSVNTQGTLLLRVTAVSDALCVCVCVFVVYNISHQLTVPLGVWSANK